MDIKSVWNKVNKNYSVIIEALVLSVIWGWFMTGISKKSFEQIESLEYLATTNRTNLLFTIVLVSILGLSIWLVSKRALKVLMFLSVYVYSILAIYNSQISIFYAVGLIMISTLALIYIKDDLTDIFRRIKLDDRTGLIVAIAAGVALMIFIGIVTVLRYRTFSNSTFDFGIFAQMFENMKNTGHPYTSVERPENGLFSHFGVHFSPIFYVMLPIYFVFSSPVTVQILQAIILGAAVIPLYFLCRHYKMSPKSSALMSILYCIFPATAAGTYYDFHENCCVPLLLFLLILALEKKKNIQTVIAAVLLLMVKEEAVLYLLLLGVYFILSGRDKKRGILMAIGAPIYFVIATAMIQSHGIGSVNDLSAMRYGNVYYDQSGGMSQMLVTLLANPAYFIKEIMNEAKIQYIILMLLPMSTALIQKKKYTRYILLGTFFLFNVIPGYQYQYDITFQYSFGAVALIMYIAIMTVSEWKPKKRNSWVLTSFVITSILFAGFTCPKLQVYIDRNKENHVTYEAMEKALKVVPENASVLTSGFVMPHLYYVNDLTVIQEGTQVDQDYVVVDLRQGYSTDFDIVGAQVQEGYTTVSYVENSIVVYKKD